MDITNTGRLANMSGNFSTLRTDTIMNFRFDLSETIKKVVFSFQIFIPRSENDTEYGINRFNMHVDLEKMMKGKQTEIITKTIVTIILNIFKPSLTFPTKEKSYVVPNFIIPGVVFRFDTKFLFKLAIFGKPMKSNKIILMSNVVVEGEISV